LQHLPELADGLARGRRQREPLLRIDHAFRLGGRRLSLLVGFDFEERQPGFGRGLFCRLDVFFDEHG
jgi:hypothetical protein